MPSGIKGPGSSSRPWSSYSFGVTLSVVLACFFGVVFGVNMVPCATCA
jgi:hypothetical protein